MSTYEIVFLIDNTGSMSPYIESVKENVASFARTLQAKNLDFSLGLLEYGDVAEEIGVPKKHVFIEDDVESYFTSDVEKFISEVGLINADMGGDGPESGLEAIKDALPIFSDEAIFKHMIVVTDADFHNQGEYGDGDYSAYLNTEDIMAELSANDIYLDVISRISSEAQTEWEPIAKSTGTVEKPGRFFNIEDDYAAVLNAILGEQTIPENAFEYGGHSYYLFSTDSVKTSSSYYYSSSITWDGIRAHCEAQGGHLAVITSEEENQALYNYMVSAGISSAYFGLTDSSVEGNWKWTNGEALGYTNWAENSPNTYDYNITDYAAFQAGGGGKWIDSDFSTYADYTYETVPRYFLCEWEPAGVVAGSGQDYENSQDDATIVGTPYTDNIYNSGDRVSIAGLEGDDNIYNHATKFSLDKYYGENVTINAGAGNDEIVCKSTDHIVYNAGDGDDKIYCNWVWDSSAWNNPLTIHLESGTFKGATLGKTSKDVIIHVDSNEITLSESVGLPIKVIDSHGNSFEFNGGVFELNKFEYEIVPNVTITAENHDGYYGEIVNAANGSAEVEPGDKVGTNKKGNINFIQIADKSHRIKTPEGSVLVEIQDPDGNKIAEVAGGAEIYWSDDRAVIDATDNPVTVNIFADNIDVIGSGEQDIISNNGNGTYINSWLGDDLITNGGTSATIVGGADDDTIKSTTDSGISLKLTEGTVKNASLSGSDVIITTSRDHVITVQDGIDKEITVTTKNRVLPTFINEYAGDPNLWLEEAAALTENARSNLENKTAESLKLSIGSLDSSETEAYTEFKKQFKRVSGAEIKDIPQTVFEAIATKLYEGAQSSKLGKFNMANPNSWIANVAGAIQNGIGFDEYTVGDYTVSASKFQFNGSGSAYITIKKNGAVFSELNYVGSAKALGEAAANYLAVLNELNKDAWWRVVTGLVQDATSSAKAGKYLTYAKKIITALVDDGSKVDDELISVIKTEINPTVKGSAVEDVIKNYCPSPYKEMILNGADAYRSVKKYQNQLNAAKSFEENEKVYTNLLNSYTIFENALKGESASPAQWFSMFFGGLGLMAGAGGLSESSFDNEDKTAYISASGSVTSDRSTAAGSIKVEDTKLVYAALTSSAQQLALGSEADSKDWDIKTLDGDDEIVMSSNRNSTLDSGAGNDRVVVGGTGDLLINAGDGDDVTEILGSARSLMTVEGGAGSDTIYSSDGAHVFRYKPEDGEDTIYDYDSYNTLHITSGNVDNVYTDEDGDLVVSVALGGKIKLKDSAEKAVTIRDADGEVTSKVYAGSEDKPWFTYNESETGLILSDTFDGDVLNLAKFDRKVNLVDASALTKDMELLGNDLANTLIGGASNSTLTGDAGDDLFVYGGGSNIITDYGKGKDKIDLNASEISDVELEDNDVKLKFADGSLKIADGHKDIKGKNKKISFEDGTKATTYIFGEHKIFDARLKGATLTAAEDFDASSKEYSRLMTISAEKAADEIYLKGNKMANKIYAGTGGSTLDGGKGNDTLVGGEGADTFVYENKSGKKVIVDYAEGDQISLEGAEVTDAFSKSNGDVILKVGSKKLTVEDAADTEITFFEDGTIHYLSDGIVYNEDRTVAWLPKKYSSKAEKVFDDTIIKIDASVVKKKVNLTASNTVGAEILGGNGKDTLTGGDGNDTIDGGRGSDSILGGAGNDYLSGGKGNDSLWGGAGENTLSGGKGNDMLWSGDDADTFLYSNGDGKDVIVGFANNDILQITGTFTGTFNADKNQLSLKVNSGSITLKDFTATEFNINDTSYVISGTALVEK